MSWGMRRTTVACLVPVAVLVSCVLSRYEVDPNMDRVGGASGTGGGDASAETGGSGASGGGTGPGGTAGTGASAGSGGSAGVGGSGGGFGCPDAGAPTVVRVPEGYGIDGTEVTGCQYFAWLKTQPATSGQPSFCSWNTDFTPTCQWPPVGKENLPVVCVDWCDARAYCQAMGKVLCGKIGGGPNAYGDYANASMSQWHNACSSSNRNAYPYGSLYDGQACNGSDKGVKAAVQVGSLQGCQSSVSGYAGVFDLSGNVWEWEDSCEASVGKSDNCRLRGGSFDGSGQELTCDANGSSYRGSTNAAYGFRCCVP